MIIADMIVQFSFQEAIYLADFAV